MNVAASEQLHERVRRFARGQSHESFEALALAIAHFQRERCPGFARLVELGGRPLDVVDAIPGVPAQAFRLARVAAHGIEQDAVRFLTSGTTSGARGLHALRTTATYRELALLFGRQALISAGRAPYVVALAEQPGTPPSSSLSTMMAWFMDELGQRHESVSGQADRWLLGPGGLDIPGLTRHARRAHDDGRPLLLLATSFALVELLDRLGEQRLQAPPGSVVMQTGGFKGKTREVEANTLRAAIARAFSMSESHVVGEYGMTELTSQLYEATLPDSELARRAGAGQPGVYLEPPWLRVIPVDPIELRPLAHGEVGLARIVDLGNVDSAVAVQTEDRVRRRGGGIELLGRAPGATPRGCALAVEELLAATRGAGT